MDKVKIGIITKPQALKGEFRVKPLILNLKQFKKLDMITIDNQNYNVEKVTLRESFAIMKLENVNTCEQAELLRNREIYAEIEVDTNDSFDLVDFDVYVEDQMIGSIVEINNYGSKDILSISGVKSCMVPLIDNIVLNTNKLEKTLILDKELFDQVVVYEN